MTWHAESTLSVPDGGVKPEEEEEGGIGQVPVVEKEPFAATAIGQTIPKGINPPFNRPNGGGLSKSSQFP